MIWEDLRDVVLVGHSYGGIVARHVADRMPDRIRSLIFIYLDAFVPDDGKRHQGTGCGHPANILQMKGLFVMGSPMVIHSGREPAIRIPRLERIFEWVGEGRITPRVSDTFLLAEYRRAMHARLTGKLVGNCLLHTTEVR
jgi:pimeloyl-ACP methyl ester carboxylesterase